MPLERRKPMDEKIIATYCLCDVCYMPCIIKKTRNVR